MRGCETEDPAPTSQPLPGFGWAGESIVLKNLLEAPSAGCLGVDHLNLSNSSSSGSLKCSHCLLKSYVEKQDRRT